MIKPSRPRLTMLKARVPTLGSIGSGSGWAPDAQRGNRHQRGYGSEWEKTRRRIIERDAGLCQACLRVDRVSLGTECDHVIPKSQGGGDNPENLEMLCRSCHSAKSAREGGQ